MSSVNVDAVIDSLRELGDEVMQRELWLSDGTSGEVSSFSETVEGLFTDSGLGDALDNNGIVFSADIDFKLRDLSHMLSSLDGQLPPNLIISDAKMSHIRPLAKQLYINLTVLQEEKARH